MKRKFSVVKFVGVLVLSILISMSDFNITTALADNSPYEKHYQVDLSSLDISLENDTIKVNKKGVPLYEKIKQDKEADIFQNQILANKKFAEDLKTMIKNGKIPIAIGVAEAEVLKTTDKDGNLISARPLTNKEVAEIHNSKAVYADTGQTQYRDSLSLYTSLSGTSPTYWVQSNAYWSSGESSAGREVLGVTWESAFGANNNSSSTINYTYGSTSASLSQIEPYHGAVWNFADGDAINYNYLNGAYVGISLSRVGSFGLHYFTSEYVHTYTTTTFSASVTFDGKGLTGSTITLNPNVEQSWHLVSYLGGNY